MKNFVRKWITDFSRASKPSNLSQPGNRQYRMQLLSLRLGMGPKYKLQIISMSREIISSWPPSTCRCRHLVQLGIATLDSRFKTKNPTFQNLTFQLSQTTVQLWSPVSPKMYQRSRPTQQNNRPHPLVRHAKPHQLHLCRRRLLSHIISHKGSKVKQKSNLFQSNHSSQTKTSLINLL